MWLYLTVLRNWHDSTPCRLLSPWVWFYCWLNTAGVKTEYGKDHVKKIQSLAECKIRRERKNKPGLFLKLVISLWIHVQGIVFQWSRVKWTRDFLTRLLLFSAGFSAARVCTVLTASRGCSRVFPGSIKEKHEKWKLTHRDSRGYFYRLYNSREDGNFYGFYARQLIAVTVARGWESNLFLNSMAVIVYRVI